MYDEPEITIIKHGRPVAILIPPGLGGATDVDAPALHRIEPARRHDLTVYDAAYLGLAEALGLGVATLDQRLAAACRTVGIPLIT